MKQDLFQIGLQPQKEVKQIRESSYTGGSLQEA